MCTALLAGLIACGAALYNAEYLLVETADDEDDNMIGKGQDFEKRGR